MGSRWYHDWVGQAGFGLCFGKVSAKVMIRYNILFVGGSQKNTQLNELYLVGPEDARAGVVNLLVLLCVLPDHDSYNRNSVAYNGRILDGLDRIEPCVLCICHTPDARLCCSGLSRPSSSSAEVSLSFSLTLLFPNG